MPISIHPSRIPGHAEAVFSMRSLNRWPLASETPVSGPPPPVLSFQVPDTIAPPCTRENVTSPSPRLSRYRPIHTRGPVSLAIWGEEFDRTGGAACEDGGGAESAVAWAITGSVPVARLAETGTGAIPEGGLQVTLDGLVIS